METAASSVVDAAKRSVAFSPPIGRVVPDDDRRITFQLKGSGRIPSVGTGEGRVSGLRTSTVSGRKHRTSRLRMTCSIAGANEPVAAERLKRGGVRLAMVLNLLAK